MRFEGDKVYLSKRNLDMLVQYGRIVKGYNSVIVEANELHYDAETEALHKMYTDPDLIEG